MSGDSEDTAGSVPRWSIEARLAISDLVARYNANSDSGRFAQALELFAADAVMETHDGHRYEGPDEILSIFTSARNRHIDDSRPPYLRHMTATHQIDLVDESSARGRCYYQVISAIGLDHWGRYIDEYRKLDGDWRFARRRVTVDGIGADAIFGADA